MKSIVIVDYGMGNLRSLSNALHFLKYQPLVSKDPTVIRNADILFLPGVGSFSQAMANIRSSFIEDALNEAVIGKKIPFMGICLGMQLIGSKGLEDGTTKGLGWIDGAVNPITVPDYRIPHVGFNEVKYAKQHTVFDGIHDNADFYFTHSYHFEVASQENILCYTEYGKPFISGVIRENIIGFQFHPEKSQYYGLKLLSNFCSLI